MKGSSNFKVFIISCLLIFTLTFCVLAQSDLPAESIIEKAPAEAAFVNVNVVPMDKEQILINQTVIIKNGIITEIGDAGKISIPRNAQKIDGRGKYLMPGLVDSHVHLYSLTEMPLYIANGVTTVFDLIL